MKIADLDDIPDLVEVVDKFYNKTHNYIPAGTTIEETVEYCINEGVAMLRRKDGVITGVFLGFFMFNEFSQKREMHELMWWSVDGSGYYLLRGACSQARIKGAKTIYISLVNTAPAAAHKIVRKLGFDCIETVHRKEY